MLALVLSVLLTATAPAATTPDMTGFTDWHGAIDSAAAYVHDVETAQLLAGIAFREWLGNLPAPPATSRPSGTANQGSQDAGRSLAGGGGSSSGDCAAGGGGNSPLPAYITQRESHDDYCAVNSSSGAYGRYQVMPYVWDANCGDLARTPDGQDACADRLSNGGSNLNPWRAG